MGSSLFRGIFALFLRFGGRFFLAGRSLGLCRRFLRGRFLRGRFLFQGLLGRFFLARSFGRTFGRRTSFVTFALCFLFFCLLLHCFLFAAFFCTKRDLPVLGVLFIRTTSQNRHFQASQQKTVKNLFAVHALVSRVLSARQSP